MSEETTGNSADSDISFPNASDIKRIKAVQERLQKYNSEKRIVQNALSGAAVNKKIRFEDYDDDDDIIDLDKILNLKNSGYDKRFNLNNSGFDKRFNINNTDLDKRFNLDDRFSDDNPNGEEEPKPSSSFQLPARDTRNYRDNSLFMKKYDPDLEDEFEQAPTKTKKTKSNNLNNVVNDTKPSVSKEQFCIIKEILKEELRKEELKKEKSKKEELKNEPTNTFSFLEMFGPAGSKPNDEKENINVEQNLHEPSTSGLRRSLTTPFMYDSSDTSSDEEMDDVQNEAPDTPEPFFFTKNDPRFVEAIEFFSGVQPRILTNFFERRRELRRSIHSIKNRLRRSKTNGFRRKLGVKKLRHYKM